MTGTGDLPRALAEIVDDFGDLAPNERLQLLLEFSGSLPELPEKYAAHPELLEQVPECQTPLFLITEVSGSGPDAVVRLHFSAPAESPTTRGFAGILHEGLSGLTAAEVLAVPSDLTERLPLADVVSPLRLRGLSAMLARIKRQVRERTAA
ncbi:MAG TPA: SufE family protein [Nakamurella sp.]|nr:SufE family protein [Nakamurella sp.]